MDYINERLLEEVASSLGIKVSQVQSVLSLLEDGSTIPFIARYRKEVTGSLDEDQIKEISKEYEYGCNLAKKKEDIKRLIGEKGMLTEELSKEIDEATKLITLEDIYRPFKEKKKTKASEAIAQGLDPLAKWMKSFVDAPIEDEAKKYITDKVPTIEKAIEGACFIIAEEISDNKEAREFIRDKILSFAHIKTKLKKNADDPKQTYKDYYEFDDRIAFLKSYRILAINRAEDEKIISVSFDTEDDRYVEYLEKKYIKTTKIPYIDYWKAAVKDSYDRLLLPSIIREVRSIITEQASDKSIKLFGENLENLLLTSPLKGMNVLGVDPAYRTGCKLAVLDKTGKFLAKDVIYQNEKFQGEVVSDTRKKEAELKVKNFVEKYSIDIISIGNGTASRETEKFIADTIAKYNLGCKYIITSEAGASVYSASKIAQEEFPDFHVEERSAVSIGRRIQDPLSELVKIDPKSIGVGQYQHDVDQAKLSDQLDFVVEKCVNEIGVNVNTASKSILSYVSGFDKRIANALITYREEHGEFKSREEIKKVPKIGDKVYEQSIGFLRIPEGINPLDQTSIHPETYKVAEGVLKSLGFEAKDLGSKELRESIAKANRDQLSKSLETSRVVLDDILDSLSHPLRDIRDSLPKPLLKSNVAHLEDLKVGEVLEGTVRNITDFGCFIDCGIKESGLLHISKMSKKRVNHPSELFKVGDIVKTKVIDIDLDRRRLALSMIDIDN